MSDKQKKGRSARRKGADGERELVHILRDFYGYDVRRGDCFRHESDVVGLPGVHIEVKRQEKMDLLKWIAQAVVEADMKGDGMPVVFHRRNRSEWRVTMRLEDWMDFYGGWSDEHYEIHTSGTRESNLEGGVIQEDRKE